LPAARSLIASVAGAAHDSSKPGDGSAKSSEGRYDLRQQTSRDDRVAVRIQVYRVGLEIARRDSSEIHHDHFDASGVQPAHDRVGARLSFLWAVPASRIVRTADVQKHDPGPVGHCRIEPAQHARRSVSADAGVCDADVIALGSQHRLELRSESSAGTDTLPAVLLAPRATISMRAAVAAVNAQLQISIAGTRKARSIGSQGRS